MKTALEGIRVLDLSRVYAGPSCGQVLADLGAEVIKVERPGTGDDTRAWGPPFYDTPTGEPSSESAYFASCNRGKLSVTLDLAHPDGQRIARSLAARCDVVIENFKAGALARYGLGYEDLSAADPRLVYCSITGFGQTGPYRARPGYDTIVQAMGGLMSVTGHPDGMPGAGPLKAGVAVTDIMTGLYAAVAVLAALQHRCVSGRGQHIDLALLDVQVAGLANIGTNYLASGKVPVRIGNQLPTLYPSDAFRCADGHMMLIVGNDRQFERFCVAAGIPAIAADPRFASNEHRIRHKDELGPIISTALAARRVDEWVALLERNGVACGPINPIDRVFQDPQVEAREMVATLEHPVCGSMRTVANPIRMSATPIRYRSAPPMLGQHTRAVLSGLLGMTDEAIADLADSGIV